MLDLKEAAKGAAGTLLALVLIAFALWLTGGADKILSLLGPNIKASSKSRGDVSSFLAGEAIRFSLKGSSPDKVFWVFDETAPQPGSIEIDHDFPFDSTKSQGVESARRVDVFFREGDKYRTASAHVHVSNVQIATAKVERGVISLSLLPPQSSDWALDRVTLGRFEKGKFAPTAPGTAIPTSTDSTDPSRRQVTFDQKVLEALGYASFGRDITKGETPYAYFDFVSPSGQRLRTVQDLSLQIKELEASSKQHP